jgi:hypothetical protein
LSSREKCSFVFWGFLGRFKINCMAGCVTGKKMYHNVEMAEEALIGAWIKNDYAPGHGPVAVYRCVDCGEYHLTSAGVMNAKLKQQLEEGKIKLQKEAERWTRKWTRRR